MAKKITQEQFIQKAREVHGDRYEYGEYVKSNEKMWICCKEHGWYEQTPNTHWRGCGCTSCRSDSMTLSLDQFIQRAWLIHGDRYEYGEYVRSSEKMWICCKEHGWYEQKPNDHLKGRGCAYCDRITQEQFIQKAREVHGDRYEYGEYVKSNEKMWICCKEHGWYEQKPAVHIGGSGCKVCSGMYLQTHDQFIMKAMRVHGDRYEYGPYTTMSRLIWICCKDHGWFSQQANNHISAQQNCPKCVTVGYSRVQLAYFDYMEQKDSVTIQHAGNVGEFKIHGIGKVDGYCEATNTCYEFHGTWWHGHPSKHNSSDTHPVSKKTYGELYQTTLERDQKIRELGYNLVVMWEHEWDLIKKLNLSNQ